MANFSKFCTCTDLNCPLHPTNHEKGCGPCIGKNLKQREIPSCFFHLVEGADVKKGTSFEDFARQVQAAQGQKSRTEG